MRFVVGSAAGVKENNPNFDLRHEVDLMMAAVMHADRVELA